MADRAKPSDRPTVDPGLTIRPVAGGHSATRPTPDSDDRGGTPDDANAAMLGSLTEDQWRRQAAEQFGGLIGALRTAIEERQKMGLHAAVSAAGLVLIAVVVAAMLLLDDPPSSTDYIATLVTGLLLTLVGPLAVLAANAEHRRQLEAVSDAAIKAAAPYQGDPERERTRKAARKMTGQSGES